MTTLFVLLLACAPGGTGKKPPESEPTMEDPPREPPVVALIPAPISLSIGEGDFVLSESTTFGGEGEGADAVARLVAASLERSTGLPLGGGPDPDVLFMLEAGFEPESYELAVSNEGVVIRASDTAGLFYGGQSLRQLLPPASFAVSSGGVAVEWRLPVVTVRDAPRYAWRGFMLDVARHFFTVEEVKRQIDLLAAHKFNRLHLHLTDDQGWRIEIRAWPDLAAIGGATEVGGGLGGFYTQEEYADLVAYAAERAMIVVPEFDVPGHNNAALASYDVLNESGVAEEPYTGQGVISTPLWLDGPATAAFVEDVFSELAELTPGPYLHVGGDEAVDISLSDYDAFMVRVQEIVAAHGKIPIGWDEIGEATLTPPVLAQLWFDDTRAYAAAEQGAGLILSPAEYAYFDMIHNFSADYGQIWAGPVSVSTVYGWSGELEGVEAHGVEAALWTEMIDDEAKLDFMSWPRLAAMAEVAWTPTSARSWPEFEQRLGWHGARLEEAGVGFYRSTDVPWWTAAEVRGLP